MSTRHRFVCLTPSSLVFCVFVCLALVVPNAVVSAADAEDEVPLETKIISATIYSRQAQVVRRGEVTLAPGSVRLVCDDLPEKLIETSLSVEGRGIDGARIIGIDLRRTPESGAESPRLDELLAEFEELEAALGPLEIRRRAILEREQLARALRNISAEQAGEQLVDGSFSATSWQSLLAFHEKEQLESEERLLALAGETAEIQKKLAWVRSEITAMAVPKTPGKDIVIDCETAVAGTLTVELSYLVPDASWHPEYTVRYIEWDSEIELTYSARIGQATGEDWNDVSLLLSTASPHVGAAPPDLSPQYLGVTTGTLRGRVTDSTTGASLPYANVSVLGTAFGTVAGADGAFVIGNVPAGAHIVQAAYMGYEIERRPRVRIVAGQAQRVDFALDPMVLGAEEVIVSADRLMIETEDTATRRAIDKRDAKVRSITSVTEAIATQPGGVVHEGEVHVRGGRAAEVKAVEAPLPIPHLEAELAGSEFAANLVIPKPVELETGAEPRRTLVIRERIPGEFVLHAVPRLSDHVFVRGTFDNPLEIPILPGAAEVYVETVPEGSLNEVSNYVGRDMLNAIASGQEFTMHLGVDQNVKVEQDLEKQTLSKLNSKTTKVRYRYVTAVESFRRDAAELRVIDRIPVSIMKDVKVEDVEIVPEPDERGEDGLLTWKLLMEPGQRREIVTEYVVEHPSHMSASELGLVE